MSKMELDWTHNKEGQRGVTRLIRHWSEGQRGGEEEQVHQKQHGGEWSRIKGEQLGGSHGRLTEL